MLIDSSGPKANIEPIANIFTQPQNSRKMMDRTKTKYIDDFSVLASIDLKKTLVPNIQPTMPVHLGEEESTVSPLQKICWNQKWIKQFCCVGTEICN